VKILPEKQKSCIILGEVKCEKVKKVLEWNWERCRIIGLG